MLKYGLSKPSLYSPCYVTLNEASYKRNIRIHKLSMTTHFRSALAYSNNRNFWCQHAVAMCNKPNWIYRSQCNNYSINFTNQRLANNWKRTSRCTAANENKYKKYRAVSTSLGLLYVTERCYATDLRPHPPPPHIVECMSHMHCRWTKTANARNLKSVLFAKINKKGT